MIFSFLCLFAFLCTGSIVVLCLSNAEWRSSCEGYQFSRHTNAHTRVPPSSCSLSSHIVQTLADAFQNVTKLSKVLETQEDLGAEANPSLVVVPESSSSINKTQRSSKQMQPSTSGIKINLCLQKWKGPGGVVFHQRAVELVRHLVQQG